MTASARCNLFFMFLVLVCAFWVLPPAAAAQRAGAASGQIKLSPTEAQWLAEHGVIRVGGPMAFPPFHYYDDKKQPEGIAPLYVRLIAARLGLKVEYQPPAPWPKVLASAREKKLDLIASLIKSPERGEFLAFSEPFLNQHIVIVTQRNAPFVGGLDDLHGKKVALIKRVPTAKWLERDGVKVRPLWVNTPLEALNTVSRGGAEACLENLAAASYLIQKNGLSNLKVAAPTAWGEYKLYFGVRKDWPILASLFSKALAAIPPEKHSEIRNRFIAVRFEHGLRAWDVVRWVLLIGLPLAILALFFLHHNRRLKREMAQRAKAERETQRVNQILQDALSDIKHLSGLLPICANCKSIRDDKGYWREVEQYVSEHTGAQFSHSLCPDCAKKLYPDLADRLFKTEDQAGQD